MKSEIDELLLIMKRLLGPGGCPWDREQNHESLMRYLIEESYEVAEAIKQGNMDELKKELGDVLLQVVFHAALAEAEGYFDFSDVVKSVSTKMIERHPHVFGNMNLESSEDVLNNWEGFKRKEGKKTLLEGIPASLPALMRAEKLQDKAARVGFDWPSTEGAIAKFKEEIDEFLAADDLVSQKEELGDMLFALVNVARMNKIDPEAALQNSNDKFLRRFNYIEANIRTAGGILEETDLPTMDKLWDESKTKGL